MSDIPAPLVPAEVDLTDFAFMPLYIGRLRKSRAWLACKKRPELAFYLINLWTRAFHEIPAGSLEDDDDVLADAAVAGSRWPKLREDVMRGWQKCSDDRMYHPVIAEIAMECWDRKLAQRKRTKAATEAREKRRNELRDEHRDEQRDVERNVSRDVHQGTGTVKGQGQGQGQGQGDSKAAPSVPVGDPVFGAYIEMLGAKGLSNGHARNFLSLMRQTYGDELVLEVLAEAQKQDISKPVPWIKKALETRQKPRGNKQESLEEKNRRAVEDWAPPEDARSSDAAR